MRKRREFFQRRTSCATWPVIRAFSQLVNKNGRFRVVGLLANSFVIRDIFPMKHLAILLLFSSAVCFAEEITLTRSAVLKADRTIVSLKAGTSVELLSRDERFLTIRYGKITGTIPVGSITDSPPAVQSARKETAQKKEKPAPPATGKATTNYGKAVEKAKENAAKHDKNLVRPTDEILN
jgi:hypothetical protein